MHNRIPNVTFRTLLLRLLVAVGICAGAAGCVSMPSAGPVQPYGVTPTAAGQQQANPQIVAQPPGPNWSPSDIVQGFLEASASFVGQQKIAREYLTPAASRAWRPTTAGAAVFKNGGPTVEPPQYTSPASPAATPPASASSRATPTPKATASKKAPKAATVTVSGTVQATLNQSGAYAFASATRQGLPFTYDLVMYNGQWRISDLNDNPLLLSSTEFEADYQLRNLYFFDPSGGYLVPDPVYVPLQATQEVLMNELVRLLITQPGDWLADGATHTAFPKGTTQLGNVVVDGGTASVNLGGTAARASDTVKKQISAQLWWTLSGGQGQQQVKSVALAVDGNSFPPGNPVQGREDVTYSPPQGFGSDYYYIDSRGVLIHQHVQASGAGTTVKLTTIGTGYSALAVSPDGDYIAALRGGQVYTGKVDGGGSLTLRAVGDGVTSLSWDRNDNLWVTAGVNGVWMLTASAKPSTPAVPVYVSLRNGCTIPSGTITALRVAPDGVRVALVYGGLEPTLAFGAIVMQGSAQPGHSRPSVTVNLSPFCVPPGSGGSSFKAVSWFGSDNVIALEEPGDSLFEYPVNGGTSATIPSPTLRPGIQSITANGISPGGGLIASTNEGDLYLTPSTTGVWNLVGAGDLPAYPG